MQQQQQRFLHRHHHDIGGNEAHYVDVSSTTTKNEWVQEGAPAAHWEKQVHATLGLLVGKGHMTVDELRRGIESLDEHKYKTLSYYEKWAVSMTLILVERQVLHPDEMEHRLETALPAEPFQVGDIVGVKPESFKTLWSKPHLRTPGYIYGQTGVVERVCGSFPYPELQAFRIQGPPQMLYRVRFLMGALWPDFGGSPSDSIDVEVYHPWLVHKTAEDFKALQERVQSGQGVHERQESSSDNQHHGHDHGHEHLSRNELERKLVNDEGPPSSQPYQRLAEAMIELLLEKNVLTLPELRQAVEKVETLGQKGEGAMLVARAWLDPDFKALLLQDAAAAAQQLGIASSNYGKATGATVLTVVENTDTVHNVIVCSLCSCYPTSLLGLSPAWYKSRSYRSRMVREPRRVLAEAFGTTLSNEVQLRVHDSTADLRYLVLPQRPAGTDDWAEEQLRALVTRDSMIGVQRDLLG